ncbi:MAG: phage tail tape measure protein [bacterium]|nr:phage tail tape measure protein [bacterium]
MSAVKAYGSSLKQAYSAAEGGKIKKTAAVVKKLAADIKGKAIPAWKKFTAKMKGAGGQAEKTGVKLDGLGGKVKDFGSKMKGMAAAGLLLVGLSAGFTDVVQALNEVEVAQASLRATAGLNITPKMDAGQKQAAIATFDALSAKAEYLGKTTQYTTTQALGAMQSLASLGFQSKQIIEMSGAALQAASASFGKVGLAESAEAIGSAIKSFGLEASQATHVVDVFARSTQITALQMGDFQRVMGTVGPIAKSAGQSIEGTVAAVGMLKNVGMTTLGAAEGVRMFLAGAMKAAYDPTKKQTEALGQLNKAMKGSKFSLTDSNGKMRSMIDIVGDLEKATGKMSEKTKQATLAGLLNVDGLKLYNAISSQTVQAKAKDYLANIKATKGDAAFEAAKKRSVQVVTEAKKATISFAEAQKKNAKIMVNGQAIAVKSYLADIKANRGKAEYNSMLHQTTAAMVPLKTETMSLYDAAEKGHEITLKGSEALRHNTGELMRATDIGKAFQEEYLATTAGKVELMKSAWDGFSRKLLCEVTPALASVTTSIASLLSETDKDTPGWIVGLKEVFGAFKPIIISVKDSFVELWNTLSGGGSTEKIAVLVGKGKEAKTVFKEVPSIFMKIKSAIQAVGAYVKPVFSVIVAFITYVKTIVVSLFSGIVAGMSSSGNAGAGLKTVLATIKRMFVVLAPIAGAVFGHIGRIIGTVISIAIQVCAAIGQAINSAIDFGQSVVQFFQTLPETISSTWSNMTNSISNATSRAWNFIKIKFLETVVSIVEKAAQIPIVGKKFKGVADKIKGDVAMLKKESKALEATQKKQAATSMQNAKLVVNSEKAKNHVILSQLGKQMNLEKKKSNLQKTEATKQIQNNKKVVQAAKQSTKGMKAIENSAKKTAGAVNKSSKAIAKSQKNIAKSGNVHTQAEKKKTATIKKETAAQAKAVKKNADTMTKATVKASKQMQKQFSTSLQQMKTKASSMNLRQQGVKLVQTFIQGFKSQAGRLKSAWGAMMNSVRKQTPSSDAKEGPLKDLTRSGGALVTTFAKGFQAQEGHLKATSQKVFAGLMPPATDTKMGISPVMNGSFMPKSLSTSVKVSPVMDRAFSGFRFNKENVGVGFSVDDMKGGVRKQYSPEKDQDSKDIIDKGALIADFRGAVFNLDSKQLEKGTTERENLKQEMAEILMELVERAR